MLVKDSALIRQETVGGSRCVCLGCLLALGYLCHTGKLVGLGIMLSTSLSAFPIHVVIYLCVAHTWHGPQILFVSIIRMRQKSEASRVNA